MTMTSTIRTARGEWPLARNFFCQKLAAVTMPQPISWISGYNRAIRPQAMSRRSNQRRSLQNSQIEAAHQRTTQSVEPLSGSLTAWFSQCKVSCIRWYFAVNCIADDRRMRKRPWFRFDFKSSLAPAGCILRRGGDSWPSRQLTLSRKGRGRTVPCIPIAL